MKGKDLESTMTEKNLWNLHWKPTLSVPIYFIFWTQRTHYEEDSNQRYNNQSTAHEPNNEEQTDSPSIQ